MPFGLSVKTITEIHTVLSRHPEIERAIIYGSRAKGNYREGSDIDLTLVGESIDYRTLRDVIDEFDEGWLPYKFDVSIFSRIDNPELVDHINRIGKLIFERASVQSQVADT